MTKVYIASAFSTDNSGGNKAGVVIGENLSIVRKKEIAKKLGFSETAFVTNSEIADFKIEYYTPTEEVPLCGHATIATFSVLRYLNKLSKSKYTIETKFSVLSIKIEDDGKIFMEQNKPIISEVLEMTQFDKALNIRNVRNDLPIQIVSTGLRDILIPINNYEGLESLEPNFDEISKISKECNVVGIHAFSLELKGETTAICRNFAPLYDINEESATGTSNCALACYLFFHNIIRKEQYIFEQGYNLESPSKIYVHIKSDYNEIDSVYVGGYGYLVETLLLS